MATLNTANDPAKALKMKLAMAKAQPGGYGAGYGMPATSAPVPNPGYGTGYAGYGPGQTAPSAAAAPGAVAPKGQPGGLTPGLMPPDIRPPTMPDWAAAIKAPAAPTAPTGPDMGNTADVDRRRAIQRLRSEQGIAVLQPYRSMSPEDQANRREFIAKSGQAASDLTDMARGPQAVQTPEQIATARNDINQKLVRNRLSQGKINPAEAGGYGSTSAIFDRVDAGQATADKALPRLAPGDAGTAQILAGQTALRAKRAEAQAGAAYRAGPYIRSAQFQREEGGAQAKYAMQLAAKQREQGLAGADAAIAQTKAGAVPAQTTLAEAPSTISAAETLAKTNAIKAKSGLAASTAVAGGQTALAPLADPQLSGHVQSFTDAIKGGVGLGDPESGHRIDQAAAGIKSYIMALPPDQAAAVKANLRESLNLSAMPTGGEIAGTIFSGPFGPFRTAALIHQKRAIADLRDFLSQ